LLPLDISAFLSLEPSEDESSIHLRPNFYVSRAVNDYTCKLWLENLAGEKFSSMTCKFKLI
jgi:hypothetical protein